jgi:HEAT repeat protein
VVLIVGGVAALLVLVCGGGGVLLYLALAPEDSGPVASTGPAKGGNPIPPKPKSVTNVAEALAALAGTSPTDRRTAVDWLGKATPEDGQRAAVATALEPACRDGSTADREAAARALVRWAGKEQVPALIRLLDERADAVRGLALDALGSLRDERAAGPLAGRLAVDADRQRAAAALEALGAPAEKEVLPYLFDADPGARAEARRLLRQYGTREDELLTRALAELKGPDGVHRQAAAEWLAQATPVDARRADVFKALEPLLTDQTASAREPAGKALARWASKEQVPDLLTMLDAPVTREAAIQALVQLKDERGAAALAAKLPTTLERDRAAAALQAMGPAAEREVLKYAFHPHNGARAEARRLLKGYGTKDEVILPLALAELKGQEAVGRRAAAEWLAQATPDDRRRADVAEALDPVLGDADAATREQAGLALARWAGKETVPALLKLFDHDSAAVRAAAVDAAVRLKDPRAAVPLARLLGSPAESKQAIKALEAFGPAAEDAVAGQLFSPDAKVRAHAQQLLKGYGTRDEVLLEQAVKALKHETVGFRVQGATWLAAVKPDEKRRDEVAKALDPLLADPDFAVNQAAVKALDGWATKDNVPSLLKWVTIGQPARPHETTMRKAALGILGKLKDNDAAVKIAPLLGNVFAKKDAQAALEAMGPLGPEEAEALLKDRTGEERVNAWRVLGVRATKASAGVLAPLAEKETEKDTMAAAKAALQAINARP